MTSQLTVKQLETSKKLSANINAVKAGLLQTRLIPEFLAKKVA